MIIGMFMILYNVKLPSNIPSMDKTNEQVTYNVLIIMFILIFVIAISIKLLPESYNLVNFFSQIKWVGFTQFYFRNQPQSVSRMLQFPRHSYFTTLPFIIRPTRLSGMRWVYW
jgi:hypothetical protein